VESWQSDAATYRSRQRYKEGIFQKGYDQGVAEMISRSIKEAFTSNDPDMVSMRSEMLRQAGVAVPQVPQGQPLPMIEDRPRHPVDAIREPMHVQLTIPFGRAKKLTVAEGYMHPKEDIKDFNQDQIPANYAAVILTWYATEYEEFEMEYPNAEGITFLGAALGSEVLWNKDDIEIILSTPTSTMTATPTSQPSVAGSCPPDDPDHGDGDDKGNGGDDKGRNSPRGTSPHPRSPPPTSPPPPPGSPSKGTSKAPGGTSPHPRSNPPTTSPPPPPGNPSKGTSKGLEGTEELGAKTPPAAIVSTSHCPPPPAKTKGDQGQLTYSLVFERYGSGEHNLLITFLCHNMVLTFLSQAEITFPSIS